MLTDVLHDVPQQVVVAVQAIHVVVDGDKADTVAGENHLRILPHQ